MSVRVDTTPLISSAVLIGVSGHGVLGSEVPSAGDAGPGYLYNDLSLPADASKEVRGLIVTPPTGLTSFFAYEDSSFEAVGSDGSYYFDYRLYVDGVASTDDIGYGAGIARATFNIGATGSTATAAAGAATVSAAGASSAAASATATAAATVSAVAAATATTGVTPAAGAATVSAAGSSTTSGSAAAVPAAGAATVSAAAQSTAATVATAAAGVATVSGAGEASTAGTTSAIAAAGLASVSATGASVAATTATAAAGVAVVSAASGSTSSVRSAPRASRQPSLPRRSANLSTRTR